MTDTIATKLSNHFTQLKYESLRKEDIAAIKRLLLDYLGVGIAGSQTGSGQIAIKFATQQGGTPECTLIGSGAKVPVTQGSFANAISSHSIELDDIDVLALFHFSPPVYSAALATAEREHADGKQLLTALAAGCEMMERVSRAANNSLRNRAYHTTPTTGVFGATVASAKLLKLDAGQITSAMGMAGAQASGLMEMYGPSMQKRFNPGPAARNGVTAGLMAQGGFTGADTIFEGERGFLRAFTDKSDASRLTENLDKPYELKIEFKPYSCARPIHNAIDCALAIRNRDKPDLNAIEKITMARHPDWALYHQNKNPATYHEGQVSLPYSVAVALKEGTALLAQYTDAKLKDPLLMRLTQCVDIVPDASLPRGVSCKMTMHMKDGKTYTSQVDYPKGSIENPMNDDELRTKFTNLAAPVIGEANAAKLAQLVANVETCKDVSEIMALTKASGTAAPNLMH